MGEKLKWKISKFRGPPFTGGNGKGWKGGNYQEKRQEVCQTWGVCS